MINQSFQKKVCETSFYCAKIEKSAEKKLIIMRNVKKAVKYVLVGNVTVVLTLLLLPVFLITDQVDALNSVIDYLWREN